MFSKKKLFLRIVIKHVLNFNKLNEFRFFFLSFCVKMNLEFGLHNLFLVLSIEGLLRCHSYEAFEFIVLRS